MKRVDLIHILEALEAAEAEFEELEHTQEWYVTNVTDQLASAKEIIISKLEGVCGSTPRIMNHDT